jgi:hypothetical protein
MIKELMTALRALVSTATEEGATVNRVRASVRLWRDRHLVHTTAQSIRHQGIARRSLPCW